ncbi:DMT family transporter [Apilactobacillus xinyiensis]|uniref:DMT family transporter n=1 Tax=Apilactobacillus xinyiensis TaxID=2841032 RepID=UPI001C7CAD94|nr:DMT family transporter [Apilactobacillus xinyiensis]MCL0318663.1 DMT family transporter [Apilactobacillus xinyiensis]
MENEKGILETNIIKGIMWAMLASALWGTSGTILQFVSQNASIPAGWFLSTRTIISGVFLLLIGSFMYGKHIFDVWKDKSVIFWLLAYGVFGLGANLMTFYLSVQTGNADASTILQYLSPVFILIGAILFQHRRPMKSDMVVFIISLLGVFLSITQGDIHKLSIPMNSLIWGVLSGVTAAFYVVLPRPVLKKYPPVVVLGWGTFIAGIVFNLHQPIWVKTPALNLPTVLGIGAIILLGTILPFLIILHALKFAPSEAVSLVDAVQPVVTFILSFIFFNTGLNFIKVLGACLVILAIFILQRSHRKLDIDKNS